jgi:hypothetical protein
MKEFFSIRNLTFEYCVAHYIAIEKSKIPYLLISREENSSPVSWKETNSRITKYDYGHTINSALVVYVLCNIQPFQ